MSKVKPIVAKALCNKYTSRLLGMLYPNKVPNVRYSRCSFSVPISNVDPSTIAQIFFGFYESEEIRFVESMERINMPVVELGASIGIVSSHICRKLDAGAKFIAVEANPNLISSLKANIESNLIDGVDFHVLNQAISYGKETIQFNFSSRHTSNRRNDHEAGHGCEVKCCSLSHVLTQYDIAEYTLVCDIEGAEIDIILNEKDALKNCRTALFELHKTRFGNTDYSVDKMVSMLVQDHKFKLKATAGNVFLFVRN